MKNVLILFLCLLLPLPIFARGLRESNREPAGTSSEEAVSEEASSRGASSQEATSGQAASSTQAAPSREAASSGTPVEYPDRYIELIVPWPPGNSTDLLSRMWASVAPEYLGQPVVVVNKAGDESVFGAEYAADAEADGYILLAVTPQTIIFPAVFGEAPYDTSDFVPLGQISAAPIVLSGRSEAQWEGVEELVEFAASNPGEVTYASVTLGTPQLAFLRWARQADLDFTHVPVASDAEAVNKVVDGAVDLAVSSGVETVSAHIESQTLEVLMVFSEERVPTLPDTPTARDAGYDVVANSFIGIAAPAGLSDRAREALRSAFDRTMQDEVFMMTADSIGERLAPLSGEEFGRVWERDRDSYAAVLETMDMR